MTTLQTLWDTGIDPKARKDAMFHTHPNDVSYQIGQGHYVHLEPNGFSPPDKQSLVHFGVLSQNWAFTSYIRSFNGITDSWQFGFSAPD